VSPDGWIVVPNWDKFQHYTGRVPPWIKLYLELEHKDEWRHLTLAQRGLLVSIWVAYGNSRGVIRASDIPAVVTQKVPRKSLEALNHAGLIQVVASKPLAPRARAREEKIVREEKNAAHARKKHKPVDNRTRENAAAYRPFDRWDD
jgi:hypothetical protein